MILIADSSALVALSICDSLTLLNQLFNEVLVPKAVYDECTQPDKAEADVLQVYLVDPALLPFGIGTSGMAKQGFNLSA